MTNKELYRSVCRQRADVPLFLKDWWLDAVCDDWDVAIAKKGEQVIGVWPYSKEQKAGVKLLRTPKLTPYLGPHIFYPVDIKRSNEDSYEHEAVTELVRQLPDIKVWHLALQPGMRQAGLFKSKGLMQEVQQTFLLDLDEEELVLLSNIKENLRRNIRAAEKEIIISESTEYLPQLYAFQKHTLRAKGKEPAYTFNELTTLFEACISHKAAMLWVAKKEESIQAIVWNVWDGQNSYYLMGGQNPESDNYRAMSALLWHVIKASKTRGNSIFDFEGSMDIGVERFFRSFGGRRELYMILKKNSSLLWKIKQAVRG